MFPIYYVAGTEANFHTLKDALYYGAEEAIRTYEAQTVMIDDGSRSYRYCIINKGDQA